MSVHAGAGASWNTMSEQSAYSRRYGTLLVNADDEHSGTREAIDGLASSVAAPPPDAMDTLRSDASRSLFGVIDQRMDNRRSMIAADNGPGSWSNTYRMSTGSDDLDGGQVVRTIVAAAEDDEMPELLSAPRPPSNMRRSRSFLDVYGQAQGLEYVREEGEKAPAPIPSAQPTTIDDVEDEDAPGGARVRTALSMGRAPVPESSQGAFGVPVASATATALAKLTGEPAAEEIPAEKKKKKSAVAVNEKGEVVKKKKKKRDKDGNVIQDTAEPVKRKKKVPRTKHRDSEAAPAQEPVPQPEFLAEPLYRTQPLHALFARDDPEWLDEDRPVSYLEKMGERIPMDMLDANATPKAMEPIQVISTRDMEVLQPVESPSHASVASAYERDASDTTSVRALSLPQPTPEHMQAIRAPSIVPSVPHHEMPMRYGTESQRMHALNYNASRLVVNAYILYRGLFVMLRKLWRWENKWLTGSVAAFYVVVWWRGDLLAIFFLLAFLYIATFRFLNAPGEELEEDALVETKSVVGVRRTPSHLSLIRRSRRLGIAVPQPSVSLAPAHLLQQVGDQVLVLTHSLADMQERMKNLALWRSPFMTLRYLGWLLVLVIISAQITTWMMVKLPGALVFLAVFVLAPLVEYGYWQKMLASFSDVPPGTATHLNVSSALLSNVLAGVPTDQENEEREMEINRWEIEREQRRRGHFLDSSVNRIVEEESRDLALSKVRRRKESKSKPVQRVMQRWEDAEDTGAEARNAKRRPLERPASRSMQPEPRGSMSPVPRDLSPQQALFTQPPMLHEWSHPETVPTTPVQSVQPAQHKPVLPVLPPPMQYQTQPVAQAPVAFAERAPYSIPDIASTVRRQSMQPAPAPAPARGDVGETESIASVYEYSDSDEEQDNRTVAQRALSALGLGFPGAKQAPASETQYPDLASYQQKEQEHVEERAAPPIAAQPIVPVAEPPFAPATPDNVHRVATVPMHELARASPKVPRSVSQTHRPAAPHQFIAAQSETLQEQLDRRQRARQHHDETLEHLISRQPSYASLAVSQDGITLSPAVSVEAVHAHSRSTDHLQPTIRWVDQAEGPYFYLAVHRKRVGHLIVFPSRIVFQLSHSNTKPLSRPAGLSELEEKQMTKEVAGRTFYPLISTSNNAAFVDAEMRNQGTTAFESFSVMASMMPAPHKIMFDVPIDSLSGLKKTRKNTPLMDRIPEGLEILTDNGARSLTIPVVHNRDAAFRRILSLGPQRWSAP
ncbi:hypothetical protein MVES1_000565 [Malassezia vespertilionis]|uniref:Uncharacterized protein n=1 Tax=Malassezia vespertilionis TaxID=2020962 RepID=A0A2N1JGZ2_9BASI|nr:uncharacterized protein MVES1_000565 [Malassezia vespertilionis]PKI85812.1 hypothetical protein MVES_000523 [Malassezia vespertilionis]WFD05237.1 hypothetical protein MVES1_000565 [Malassezia vespertilionis]